jgi:hypothetical protein
VTPVFSTSTIILVIAHSLVVIPLNLSPLLLQKKSDCFLRAYFVLSKKIQKNHFNFSVISIALIQAAIALPFFFTYTNYLYSVINELFSLFYI